MNDDDKGVLAGAAHGEHCEVHVRAYAGKVRLKVVTDELGLAMVYEPDEAVRLSNVLFEAARLAKAERL